VQLRAGNRQQRRMSSAEKPVRWRRASNATVMIWRLTAPGSSRSMEDRISRAPTRPTHVCSVTHFRVDGTCHGLCLLTDWRHHEWGERIPRCRGSRSLSSSGRCGVTSSLVMTAPLLRGLVGVDLNVVTGAARPTDPLAAAMALAKRLPPGRLGRWCFVPSSRTDLDWL